MSGTVLDLQPKRLWYYFNEFCKIPHGSRDEERIGNYIINFAKEHGLEYMKDATGNIVVRKAAASANKNSKPMVIQSHLDMVCEVAEGVKVDFKKDPIKPCIDCGWVAAEGTSLGSDNGIGNAAMLAILESKDIAHGPLECLFTVDEETGLNGAQGLQSNFLKGRTMLNLDAEVDGILYIACAGARFLNVKIPFKKASTPSGYLGLEVSVSGLLGGHSGLTIQEQKGNAVKILGRLLSNIRTEHSIILSSINGGTKHNVIPSGAVAIIAVKKDEKNDVEKRLSKVASEVKDELTSSDPACKISIKDAGLNDVLDQKASDNIINFINAAPHGVFAMSLDIKGLVQTSLNFAIAKTESDHCYMEVSIRSSVASEIEAVKGQFLSLTNLIGLEAEEFGGYPGWQPNLKSTIFKLCKEEYQKMFGQEPNVTMIHAGLECGIIGEKYAGMDMISFGPQIEGAHSVKERVEIKSVEKFWKYLVKVLEEFAK